MLNLSEYADVLQVQIHPSILQPSKIEDIIPIGSVVITLTYTGQCSVFHRGEKKKKKIKKN